MSTALAQRQDLLPDATTLKTMLDMAGELVKSGLLPQAIKTPAAAMAIIQKGRELGIPPMYALSNIGIINGKPVVGAEVFLAMIYRDHGDQAIQFEETSGERCSVVYKRRSWAQYRRFEWTIQDAENAGLLGKGGPWKQYPPAMLRARCISAVARLAFPDSIGGMHTPEELGAEVTVTDDGAIEVVQAAPTPIKVVPRVEDVTPAPPSDRRPKLIAKLTAGIAAAKAIGLDPEALDPETMTDQAILEVCQALAQQIAAVQAAQAEAVPTEEDDAAF